MSTPVTERRIGRVVELTLNRPDVGNAIGLEMVEALLDRLDALDPDACDTVVLRGAGKGFCGGLDLTGLDEESDATLFWRLVRIEMLLQKVAALPQLTVAIAHRFAFGAGADLFAACRRRIAAPGTKFAFPGVRFGIALGTGRLGRRVGPDAAREMLATTAPIELEQALARGLAGEAAAQEDWDAIIDDLATAETSLDARMARIVAERLDPRTDEADMAALVASAGEPGLKQRIASYAAAVAAARKR